MIKNRFIGIFSIPLEIINDQPSDVLDFMNGMIVLKAEYIPEINGIEYTAISPQHFKPVPSMERAPQYVLSFSDKGIQVKPE